jgi:hypothetical protein
MVQFARGRHSEREQDTMTSGVTCRQLCRMKGNMGSRRVMQRRHIGQGPSAAAQGEASEWGTWGIFDKRT